MKQTLSLALVLMLLTGCQSNELNRGLQARKQLLTCTECTFLADVAADYGDTFCTFTLSCRMDGDGSVTFRVTDPEAIRDITGKIDRDTGTLTFDDTVLAFPLLVDGLLSPVAAPWVLLKALRSGYITAAAKETDTVQLSLRDTLGTVPCTLELWLDSEQHPLRGEIYAEGRRFLSVELHDFVLR